jgi:geranylgeranyl transferase type-2 subunit beta
MGFLDLVDKEKTINYILSCRNYDNGFGSQPDAESHGAYVFTALGTLKILDGMNRFDNDKLAYWLGER